MVCRTAHGPLGALYLSVHVVGPEDGSSLRSTFARAGCEKSLGGLDECDLVVFTGSSSDVHPELYGEKIGMAVSGVMPDPDIMKQYLQTYLTCLEKGIPMVGICLGAQFLHVMNGGKLYQKVDGHTSEHPIYDPKSGQLIARASSVHNQACEWQADMDVLAVATTSNCRWKNKKNCVTKFDKEDVEVFWYGETGCLGFQGHPEYPGYWDYSKYFIRVIHDMIVNNPDFVVKDNKVRLRQEVISRRNYKLPKSVTKYINKYV